MTADPSLAEPPDNTGKRLWWILPLCVLLVIAGAAFAAWRGAIDRQSEGTGARVAEKLATLRTDRIALQARPDGEPRVRLLEAFRLASLLIG